MSQIVALAGHKGIVLASDTILTSGDDEAYYQDSRLYSKIHVVGAGRFAVGVAGSVGGEPPVRAHTHSTGSFKEVEDGIFLAMKREYQNGTMMAHVSYLFCGFDGAEPRISTASFATPWTDGVPNTTGVEPSKSGKAAVGIDKHGALQWMYSFHTQEMPLGNLKLLACFCLGETIRHDHRARKPFEMMIIRPCTPVEVIGREEIENIEQEYEERREKVRALLYEPDYGTPKGVP